MKEALATVGVVISVIGFIWLLGFSGLIFGRAAAPFAEETRRITYQESVTAQTACRGNLSRLYVEWSKAAPAHKTALEAMARDESIRYRCKELAPAVSAWVATLK